MKNAILLCGIIACTFSCGKKIISSATTKILDDTTVVFDVDGNRYNVLKIDSILWMIDNLSVTHLSDGTGIELIEDSAAWRNTTKPAYCWFNNDSITYAKLGRLYNYYAVEARNICPAGWDVPGVSTWNEMAIYTGLLAPQLIPKEMWKVKNDSIAQAFIPENIGGIRGYNGTFFFENQWWSWHETNKYLWTYNDKSIVPAWHFGKAAGMSVRCVKYLK